jgi:hypothetical protein
MAEPEMLAKRTKVSFVLSLPLTMLHMSYVDKDGQRLTNRQLANGMSMPQIQLGLYMMSGPETTKSVAWALSAGYRGFDSAQWYYNERETGEAIKAFLGSEAAQKAGLAREHVHFTSKLRDNSSSYDAVRRSIRKSVDACGLGYIDLFLLHSPLGGREARLTSWKALEDAVLEGEVKMAGVSNFGTRHVSVFPSSSFLSFFFSVVSFVLLVLLLLLICRVFCHARRPSSPPPLCLLSSFSSFSSPFFLFSFVASCHVVSNYVVHFADISRVERECN